jgi:RNA polymerase-interacting CarD/CdnL/TRCF family regulator
MDFKIGDTVIHCTYGPGRIVRLEEQAFSGEKTLYNRGMHFLLVKDERKISLRSSAAWKSRAMPWM